jgi:DNA-binding NarL/FixJ family response regulator
MSETTSLIDLTSASIRILITDDHRMFAEGIGRLLAGLSDMVVVGLAATSTESVAMALAEQPDVLVVDYQLPDANGIETSQAVLAVSPTTKIVVITGFDDDDVMFAAMQSGCSAFLTKDRAGDELVHAVRAAYAGEVYLTPAVLPRLIQHMTRSRIGLGADLTEREREILVRLAKGASTREIALHFRVSVHTVRNHVQHILDKLGAHSKLEAVVIATRAGLVESAAT